MHQAFSLLSYHVHLVLPKRRWEWRPWLHISSLADHERSSVMGYVIMALKKVALGFWTMSLRSWMMPAHCFDQQTTFPFVTLLLLKEWFLGACNMNFVIPPPLSLQHPFTPYPSLQLHPSWRPSTYTCRSPSQSNQAQAISSRFPIYISQAENHLTEFY